MFNVFKRLYAMTKNDRMEINISFVLQFFDSMLSFIPLGASLYFYEKYLNDDLTSKTPLIIFAMLAMGVLIRVFVRYYMDKNQYSTIYRLFYNERIKIADYLKRINMGFFTDDNIGKITTTLINGISFVEEQCMMAIIIVITSVVQMIVILGMLLYMNVQVALIFLATTVVVALILIPYEKKSAAYSIEHNRANEVLTSAVIEYVKNISVIKSFNLLGKHKRSNDAFVLRKKIDLSGEVLSIKYIVGTMIIMAVGVGIIILGVLTQYESLMLYDVIMLIILALYLFRALEAIVLKVTTLNIAEDSLNNIAKLYDEPILEDKGDKKPNGFDIEFKNVEFAYENKNVLNDISFKLKENTMNALVGLSGSGKSTLVNLIPRFFDVNKGQITIGGVDVREMSGETLNSCISMVFQNVYLFKDTIYNNILFGNDDATKEDVINACKKARCYDFIMALPEGFETIVGEAGLTLSGGERQRVSIARAILKDAPIILLDEATASVDPDNEYEIQEAINALVEKKTILVIAHKLSCVKNAEKILVIDDGKLIEEGNHVKLLEDKGAYYNLWKKRNSSKSWKIKA